MQHNRDSENNIELRFSVFVVKNRHTGKAADGAAKKGSDKKCRLRHPPLLFFCAHFIISHHEKQYQIQYEIVNQ